MGLENLKRKFNFLSEYSDEFIKAKGVNILIKAETASRKLQKLDKERKAEDKLYQNRESLTSSISNIPAGTDNRLDILHPARFLPGATCSAAKMWLQARSVMGGNGTIPLSTYDMASIGLGGSVSAKGWVEIHNPSSPFLSIRMFSMNSCVTKSKAPDSDFPDMEDISEFKAALRVLRGAMAFVHPWNRFVNAIESFFVQNNFCASDISGTEKQAHLLSQFCDYVLVENASRWRGMEPFLDTRALRNTWANFASQKSLSAKSKPQFTKGKGNNNPNNHSNNHNNPSHQHQQQQFQQQQWPTTIPPSMRYNMDPRLFKEDICVLFNLGKCLRTAVNCNTKGGKPLRHVCNHRPDPTKPDIPCGQNHMAKLFH